MKNQDQKRFAIMMNKLGVVFSTEITNIILEVYFEAFEEYDIDELEAASKKVIKTKEYKTLPVPSEIIKAIEYATVHAIEYDADGFELNPGDEDRELGPVESFIELWNTFSRYNNLAKIQNMASDRIVKLKERLKDPWWEKNYGASIYRIEKSKYLQGKNDRRWKADVDWFLKNTANAANILEGKYDDNDEGRFGGGSFYNPHD